MLSWTLIIASPARPWYTSYGRGPMTLFENPQVRVAFIWAAVGAFATACVIIPFIPFLKIDAMQWGYGMACMSSFVAMMCGIATLFYIYRAFTLQRILNGEGVLAHWTYSPEEWSRFTQAETKRDRAGKITLFFIVAGFALFFGLIFAIFGGKEGIVVLLITIGLTVFIGGVAAVSIAWAYLANKRGQGEVTIARDGILQNKAFHNWNHFGGRLDRVFLREDESLLLEFDYSYPSRTGRQTAEVRIPVPAGREEEARRVAGIFNGEAPEDEAIEPR